MSRVYTYAFSKAISDRGLDINTKIEIIKECVESGPLFDINCNSSAELIIAIENLDYPLVKILLECGMDVTAQDNRAIIIASNHVLYLADILKLLISYGADPIARNNEPICGATNVNTVKFLIDLGADPLAQNNKPFCMACYSGKLSHVKFLFEFGVSCIEPDNAPINAAVDGSNSDIIRFLLDNGADPNIGDNEVGNLLEKSVYLLDIEICELLLEYGADITLCKLIPDGAIYPKRYMKSSINKINEIIDLFESKNADISHIINWIG